MASSFVRAGTSSKVNISGTRPGLHGRTLISSGILHLDEVLGGGIPLGTLVLVLEDSYAPHHLTLLRHFVAQGVTHSQPLLFAAPLPNPGAFLGTLPAPVAEDVTKKVLDEGRGNEALEGGQSKQQEGGDGLRIAWQYRRFLNEQRTLESSRIRQATGKGGMGTSAFAPARGVPPPGLAGNGVEYCATLDLRKPISRPVLAQMRAECVSTLADGVLPALIGKCTAFVQQLSRPRAGEATQAGRIAVQSLCSPQCAHSAPANEWEVLAFLHSLKGLLRSSPHASAVVTLPASTVSHSLRTRALHLADVALAVEALSEDDAEMGSSLADFSDMLGFLRVLKLPSLHSLVPVLPETMVYALKLVKRRYLTLAHLSQGPVDAGGGGGDGKGSSVAASLCSKPPGASSLLDF